MRASEMEAATLTSTCFGLVPIPIDLDSDLEDGFGLGVRIKTVEAPSGNFRSLVATRSYECGDTIFQERALFSMRHSEKTKFNAASPDLAESFLTQLQWHPVLAADHDARMRYVRQLAPEAASPASVSSPGRLWRQAREMISRNALSRSSNSAELDAAQLLALSTAIEIKLVMDSNAFMVQGSGSSHHCAVAMLASMMNHSCYPNVAHTWRLDPEPTVRVIALRAIAPGDEICTRYIDTDTRPKHSRKRILREKYGFSCCCCRCAPRGDDAMVFLCPNRCDQSTGRVLGWCSTCSNCGAEVDDTDVMVDDRAQHLAEAVEVLNVVELRSAAIRTGEITRTLIDIAERDDIEGVASPTGVLSTDTGVEIPPAPDLEAVTAGLANRLHPSDAAFNSFLRKLALHYIQAGEHARALHWAVAAFDSVPLMPYLSAPVVVDVAHLVNLAGGNGFSPHVFEKQNLLSKLKW